MGVCLCGGCLFPTVLVLIHQAIGFLFVDQKTEQSEFIGNHLIPISTIRLYQDFLDGVNYFFIRDKFILLPGMCAGYHASWSGMCFIVIAPSGKSNPLN